MGDFFKNIDWDLLDKWNTIIGITTSIISTFYLLRWIARRARSSVFIGFISWSVTGDENEQTLVMTLKGFIRLIGASLIWVAIGGIVGLAILLALHLLSSILGSQSTLSTQTLIQYSGLGMFIGALFRGIIWPLYVPIRNIIRIRAEERAVRQQEFAQRKERVQRKMKRGTKE